MLGFIAITPWHWAGFLVCVFFFLALDLGVFHRHSHVVKFKEALGWSILWVTLSFVFGLLIGPAFISGWEKQDSIEFITGYIIELSLSMDNVFVIALIFTYFRVAPQYQHRVLFWGILGALVMRGVMIGLGTALIHEFSWIIYIFGAFLIFTGLRMAFHKDEELHPEDNPLIKLFRRFIPVSETYEGDKFFIRRAGVLMSTPLFLVLLMIESTDLIFAVDSIPAIFAVTQNPFLVYTSNVFAILGLRSLYFVLAGVVNTFYYLKLGLAVVLTFVGTKMLLIETPFKIPTLISLGVVALILGVSIVASLIRARSMKRASTLM